MAKYTQTNRPMGVTTPLGADVLLLEKFTGTEALSQLFNFQLDLLADAQTNVAFDQLLGQSVTIRLNLASGSPRYFNGIVSRFSQGGQVAGVDGQPTFIRYRAELVPQFWLLTRNLNSRIFQQKAVTDILKTVLTGLNVSYQLQATYKPRDYCTQYRETDFAFASRLMEETGMYYYFTHSNGSHQLVVGDTPQSNSNVPGPTSVTYETILGGPRPDDRVLTWERSQEVRAGKTTLWDYCFQMPTQNLQAQQPTLGSVQTGTVNQNLSVANNSKYERYEYPGYYAKHYDDVAAGGGDQASNLQDIFTENAQLATVREQQDMLPAIVIRGESGCRQFNAGCKFTLTKHFNGNGQYVLTRVEHNGSLEGAYSSTQETALFYGNLFECIPVALPFRPLVVTPKARIDGPQTAVVVGPSGQEIFTDKYGRVKVQFHWDRQGKNNASSSCWVRVATSWAGPQWGTIFIPRIGQEVVVAFEDGDPDQPVIVGCVYNATNMPPYTLPDNMTRSTIKSRSTTGGSTTTFNELRFEDKKGSEQVFLNAQFDMDHRVNNDHREFVKNNRSLIIQGNQLEQVKGNLNTTIQGNQLEQVNGNTNVTVKGNHAEQISGNMSLQVGGNQQEKISSTLTVEAGFEVHFKAGSNLILEAGSALTLVVGGCFINISSSAVAIVGMQVNINSGGSAGSGTAASPSNPEAPKTPDTADDGTKGTKLN